MFNSVPTAVPAYCPSNRWQYKQYFGYCSLTEVLAHEDLMIQQTVIVLVSLSHCNLLCIQRTPFIKFYLVFSNGNSLTESWLDWTPWSTEILQVDHSLLVF